MIVFEAFQDLATDGARLVEKLVIERLANPATEHLLGKELPGMALVKSVGKSHLEIAKLGWVWEGPFAKKNTQRGIAVELFLTDVFEMCRHWFVILLMCLIPVQYKMKGRDGPRNHPGLNALWTMGKVQMPPPLGKKP